MLRVFVRSGYGYLPLSCAAHARTLVVAEGDYRRRLPDHLRRNPRAIRIAYPESGAFIASQHELVGDMLHVAAIEKSEGLNTDQCQYQSWGSQDDKLLRKPPVDAIPARASQNCGAVLFGRSLKSENSNAGTTDECTPPS